MSDLKRSVLRQIAFVWNLTKPRGALELVGILTIEELAERSGLEISRIELTMTCIPTHCRTILKRLSNSGLTKKL